MGESSDVTKPTPSSCQPNTYKTRRNILGQTTDLIVMSACNQIETGVLKTHSNRDDVCGALEKAQQSVSSDPSKVNNDGLHNEYVVMTSNQTMSTS